MADISEGPLQVRTQHQRNEQLIGERLLRQSVRPLRNSGLSLEEAQAHMAAHWRSTLKQDATPEAQRNWAADSEITG